MARGTITATAMPIARMRPRSSPTRSGTRQIVAASVFDRLILVPIVLVQGLLLVSPDIVGVTALTLSIAPAATRAHSQSPFLALTARS
jgi:hypothetical protein